MKLKIAVLASALSLLVVADVVAAPISFDDTFNPTDVYFDNQGGVCTGNVATDTVTGLSNTACVSLAYSYTIPGFDASTDTLSSASLILKFYDDTANGDPGTGGQPESVDITLDGILVGNEVTVDDLSLAGLPFSPSFDVRAKLADNGTLSIFLELGDNNAGNNDFFFAESRLVARGETGPSTPPTSAPEPATFGLFGLAAALGLRNRFSAKRRRSL